MDEAKREISEAFFDNKLNSNPIETLPNGQDKINFQSQKRNLPSLLWQQGLLHIAKWNFTEDQISEVPKFN